MRSWPEAVGLAGLGLALACGDGGEPTAGDSGAYDEGLAACEALTWETFGEGYFQTWCTGCHSSALPEGDRAGAPVGVDFDTYAGAAQWADRIDARVLSEPPTMPPVGGSSDAERDRLAAWLDCGLPE